MAYSSLWWLAAGAAVVVELLTGTFYLLMIGIGLAAGALAAHAGLSLPLQMVVSAIVGGGAVFGCYWRKRQQEAQQPVNLQAANQLDVGEQVQVTSWNPDHTAQVRYRGALWQASLRAGAAASNVPTAPPGLYRIVEVVGNRLLLEPV